MRADYVWVESYNAAVIETDDKKLPERIQVAKNAIDTRSTNCKWTTEVRRKSGWLSLMRLGD